MPSPGLGTGIDMMESDDVMPPPIDFSPRCLVRFFRTDSASIIAERQVEQLLVKRGYK